MIIKNLFKTFLVFLLSSTLAISDEGDQLLSDRGLITELRDLKLEMQALAEKLNSKLKKHQEFIHALQKNKNTKVQFGKCIIYIPRTAFRGDHDQIWGIIETGKQHEASITFAKPYSEKDIPTVVANIDHFSSPYPIDYHNFDVSVSGTTKTGFKCGIYVRKGKTLPYPNSHALPIHGVVNWVAISEE